VVSKAYFEQSGLAGYVVEEISGLAGYVVEEICLAF